MRYKLEVLNNISAIKIVFISISSVTPITCDHIEHYESVHTDRK